MIQEKDSGHNDKKKSRPNEGDDHRPNERPVVGILEGLKQIVIHSSTSGDSMPIEPAMKPSRKVPSTMTRKTATVARCSLLSRLWRGMAHDHTRLCPRLTDQGHTGNRHHRGLL